jgi:hypothetical protein
VVIALPRGLRILLLSVVAAAAVCGPLAPARAEAAEGTVAVVVHPDVPVTGVTLDELRDLVLGNQRFWRTGLRVELIVGAVASLERSAFVGRLSGMSEIQFQQYWIGQVFRGRATSAPRAVPDARTALALVATLPGALALVDASVTDPRVRVVAVDGLRPDAAGYALR